MSMKAAFSYLLTFCLC